MANEFIPISKLTNLPTRLTTKDLMLVSRSDDTTGQEIITSYKLNGKTLENDIYDDVVKTINDNFCTPEKSTLDKKTQDMKDDYTAKKKEIDDLSCKVTNEWNSLSTYSLEKLEELSTRITNTCNTLDSLCVTVSTEISTFIVCAEISIYNQMKWLQSYLSNDLATLIKNWVSLNFVTLTTDQTITGNKTFTRDIKGTALSARWI